MQARRDKHSDQGSVAATKSLLGIVFDPKLPFALLVVGWTLNGNVGAAITAAGAVVSIWLVQLGAFSLDASSDSSRGVS